MLLQIGDRRYRGDITLDYIFNTLRFFFSEIILNTVDVEIFAAALRLTQSLINFARVALSNRLGMALT